MASVKLTQNIRSSIQSALLKHKFSAQADQLAGEFADLAVDVYNDVFSASERQIMAGLPKGWLAFKSHIAVAFHEGSTTYIQLGFSGRSQLGAAMYCSNPSDDEARRVPYSHYYGCSKNYPVAHRLSVRHQKLVQRREQLESEIAAAKSHATAALEICTTLGALIKAWPEVKPFAERFHPPVESRQLPAIVAERLNDMFDLPVEEAA